MRQYTLRRERLIFSHSLGVHPDLLGWVVLLFLITNFTLLRTIAGQENAPAINESTAHQGCWLLLVWSTSCISLLCALSATSAVAAVYV
jgi:hypothetical protein